MVLLKFLVVCWPVLNNMCCFLCVLLVDSCCCFVLCFLGGVLAKRDTVHPKIFVDQCPDP